MNRAVSRFERPSTPLKTKTLLGKGRRALWWALALALGAHLSLTRLVVIQTEQKVAKPLELK